MPKPFETDRLRLRPLTSGDYGFMRALHSDPRVMRHIAAGATRTEEQTRDGVARALAIEAADPLLGAWIAESRTTGEPVGNLILRKPATADATEGLEIGFMFATSEWGKGYATEASRGIIDYVRARLGDVRIVALIDPVNAASRRTLTKLGFATVGTGQYVDPVSGALIPTEILALAEPAR